MIFDSLKNGIANIALNTLKEKLMSQYLDGIGIIKKISYENGKIFLTLILEGLEDKPIDITCSEIDIAADGSAITVRQFESNMPFVKNVLNRYAVKTFAIPSGKARLAAECVKKGLGL